MNNERFYSSSFKEYLNQDILKGKWKQMGHRHTAKARWLSKVQ
jgi:hypothetical protein